MEEKEAKKEYDYDRFETKNDNSKHFLFRVLAVFVPFYALIIFLKAVKILSFELFLGNLISFSLGLCFCIFFVTNTKSSILFKNNVLLVKDLKRYRHYEFSSLKLNDFKFRQSERQKKNNTGRVRVKGARMSFLEAENYSEFKDYVEKHFK